MIEILIREDEIQWVMERLVRIYGTEYEKNIKDIVRNEENQIEIRLKPIVLGD